MKPELLIVKKMLKEHGLKWGFQTRKGYDDVYSIQVNKRTVLFANTFKGRDTDYFSICHEIGHYLDVPWKFVNFQKEPEKWKRVIRYEYKAWKIACMLYKEYFKKPVNKTLLEYAGNCLALYGIHFMTALKKVDNDKVKYEKKVKLQKQFVQYLSTHVDKIFLDKEQ